MDEPDIPPVGGLYYTLEHLIASASIVPNKDLSRHLNQMLGLIPPVQRDSSNVRKWFLFHLVWQSSPTLKPPGCFFSWLCENSQIRNQILYVMPKIWSQRKHGEERSRV